MMVDELAVQKECRRQHLQNVRETEALMLEAAKEVQRIEPTPTERMTLLLGASQKLAEAGRAILRIADIGAVDEMNVLLRTQVEMVVNVCSFGYLSDEEFSRFVHHDAINSYIAMQDMSRTNLNGVEMPAELVERVTRYANEAAGISGVPLTSRWWNLETKNLKDRATIVDAALGNTDLAGMLATVYVTGSGYTHAGYKTLQRHAHYLVTGKTQHPLATLFGCNNVIQGLSYVMHIYTRHLGNRFGISTAPVDALAKDSIRILDTARHDFGLHRQRMSHKSQYS